MKTLILTTKILMERGSKWRCSQCYNSNVITKSKCATCACFRSKSTDLDLVNGDWKCKCGELNFSGKDICRKCNRNQRILHELFCYESVNYNIKIITIFYEDYKCNKQYLNEITGNKTIEECAEYIGSVLLHPSEYSDYKLKIDAFKINGKDNSKDVQFARLLIEKLGDRVTFINCSLPTELC